MRPGVYRLPAGTRVYQAVEQAGGLSSEADPEAFNMALPL
ncbi:MAG: Competence protein ComEA-like protein with helix-hairpin-helix repeat region, partial [Synergistales bacterium 57_84]